MSIMQSIKSVHFITTYANNRSYIIPLHNITSITCNEKTKCMSINLNNQKIEIYSDDVKKSYYDIIKDIRLCDGHITNINALDIVD